MRLVKYFVLLGLAACGSTPPAPPTTGKPEPAQPAGDPACPVEIAGTSVSVEDAPTGAALVFVTTGDVAELRKRVAAMAKQHNDHHAAMGPLPDGSGSAAGGHDHHHDHQAQNGSGDHAGHASGGGMISVHSKAAAGDIANGAQIMFTSGAGDVAKLQSELRMHAEHLGSGTCRMGS